MMDLCAAEGDKKEEIFICSSPVFYISLSKIGVFYSHCFTSEILRSFSPHTI